MAESTTRIEQHPDTGDTGDTGDAGDTEERWMATALFGKTLSCADSGHQPR